MIDVYSTKMVFLKKKSINLSVRNL